MEQYYTLSQLISHGSSQAGMIIFKGLGVLWGLLGSFRVLWGSIGGVGDEYTMEQYYTLSQLAMDPVKQV